MLGKKKQLDENAIVERVKAGETVTSLMSVFKCRYATLQEILKRRLSVDDYAKYVTKGRHPGIRGPRGKRPTEPERQARVDAAVDMYHRNIEMLNEVAANDPEKYPVGQGQRTSCAESRIKCVEADRILEEALVVS